MLLLAASGWRSGEHRLLISRAFAQCIAESPDLSHLGRGRIASGPPFQPMLFLSLTSPHTFCTQKFPVSSVFLSTILWDSQQYQRTQITKICEMLEFSVNAFNPPCFSSLDDIKSYSSSPQRLFSHINGLHYTVHSSAQKDGFELGSSLPRNFSLSRVHFVKWEGMNFASY